MTVMTHKLGGEDWYLAYDVEAKVLSVKANSSDKQFSLNDFLALHSGTRAGGMLELIIIDLFNGGPESVRSGLQTSSVGSLAMLDATRRASSIVSTFAVSASARVSRAPLASLTL